MRADGTTKTAGAQPPAGLEVVGLSKSFGATRALRGVDLAFAPGEVHALVGENGAGKSTLIKIVCGVHGADGGAMRLGGAPYAPASPAEAARRGIVLVPQELRVVPAMTAAENVFLGDWPARRRFGLTTGVDRAAMRAAFEAQMARLGVVIDPAVPARELSFAERQLLVLARGLRRAARLLVFDEPTASLERAEAVRLFEAIERLRAGGLGIVFISHRLAEVEEVAARVTVLRDGAVAASHARGTYAAADLIRAMTGRDLGARAAPTGGAAGAERLSAEVGAEGSVALSLRASRALGLVGLLGSGGDVVLRRLFGAGGPQEARKDGVALRLARPRDAIRAGAGYVPSERRLGILPNLSVAQNILLPHLGAPRRPGPEAVARMIALLDVRPADPQVLAGSLSGGNQQKVLFARWLVAAPEILLLDEPTHGVDVAAKVQIHALINRFVAEGGAALVNSAEFPELLELCDEVALLREGRELRRLARGATDYTEQVIRETLGG